MLKILQARLQQYVNQELPDVQAGFSGPLDVSKRCEALCPEELEDYGFL